MEIKKAEIKDLNTVVKLKMDMFTEVGSIALLQDNAEEQIYEKYKELYQEEKCCHYLLYEKFGFCDSGEMEINRLCQLHIINFIIFLK